MIKIELLPFTPKWIESFKQEKRVLQASIGNVVAIEHIGSTAVPDLMAKPMIDIFIGVNEFNHRSFFISAITSLGYHYIPEYEVYIPERKYFQKVQDGHHIAHIHLVKKDKEFWNKHILFRDLLRSNLVIRNQYAKLKVSLANQEWTSRNEYAAAKTTFISRVLEQYEN